MLGQGDRVRILYGGYSGLEGEITAEAGNVYGFHVVYIPEMDRTAIFKDYELEILKQESEDGRMDETMKTEYQRKIEDLMDRQREKGLSKYGVTLEENVTLTAEQRISHLEEEMIDGLMYCEHLKKVFAEPGITADDYQRAALRTAQTDRYGEEELLLNGVMGLCGEAGEVIDLVKKARFQGHELDKEKLMLEISDCLWYCAVASYAIGYKLSDVMEANIKKLKERYPEGFDKARSIGRREYREGTGEA